MELPPPFDEEALELLDQIERALVRLGLERQGEFIAIINAIEMQLESGDPYPVTIAHLGDALLSLAHARGVDANALNLPDQLKTLIDRTL